MKRLAVPVVAVALLACVAGWYWFRPDRAFIDARVNEAPPSVQAVVLSRGVFVPRAHEGAGTATILRMPDGRRVLRFTAFETLNGPDVRVYLLGGSDVHGAVALEQAGYIDLGPLKGNIGDQNYEVPPAADLDRYPVVSVWCRRFGVNFTQAILIQS